MCSLCSKVMCNNGSYPAGNWKILTDHHEIHEGAGTLDELHSYYK